MHDRWLLALLTLALLVFPAAAAERYFDGAPNLTATVTGSSEFSSGDEVPLTLLIQNSGTADIKILDNNKNLTIESPSTAMMMIATLLSGEAPVEVRTDPQMIGSVKSGMRVPVTYTVKIAQDAPGGEYILPLKARFIYLAFTEQIGGESLILHYENGTASFSVPIRVKYEVVPVVVSAKAEYLSAAGEGYINLTVKNTGSITGESAVLKIQQNNESPVIPVDTNVYLGDFAPESVKEVRYRVAVNSGAQEAIYPIDVIVEYRDNEGSLLTTDPVTVGVPVASKAKFTVISQPLTLTAGSTEDVTVVFENIGGLPVYRAQARISLTDPFSSSNDNAYLGDLMPGEQAPASFSLTVDKAATIKEYALDAVVRFRDPVGEYRISDPMKVRVTIVPRQGLDLVLGSPVVLATIIAIVVLVGYYILQRRKR